MPAEEKIRRIFSVNPYTYKAHPKLLVSVGSGQRVSFRTVKYNPSLPKQNKFQIPSHCNLANPSDELFDYEDEETEDESSMIDQKTPLQLIMESSIMKRMKQNLE